jgi:glycosyltransferase involved in cell wall biosynthesis
MPLRQLTAVPVYNEERHISGVLDEVCRHSQDVLVIDDGSTDETPQLLARRDDICVITHGSNQGYGAALRSSFRYAIGEGYDVLVTVDCDGQHEPVLIPEIAAALCGAEGGDVDLVSGSRYLKTFPGNNQPPLERRRINMEITRILNDRLGLRLTDAFCGFKAYRVESLARFEITELGYAMPLQLWVQAAAAPMRIVEFPVPLVYLEEERSFGGSLDDGGRRMAYYREVLERAQARVSLPCRSE